MSEANVSSAIPILRVASVDETLPLYTALGFTVAWEHRLEPDAPRLVSVRHGTVELYLTEHAVAPFGGVTYLATDGVDALVSRAIRAGFHPSFGPEDRPWGDREAYFTDTDGNVLRFGEPI